MAEALLACGLPADVVTFNAMLPGDGSLNWGVPWVTR